MLDPIQAKSFSSHASIRHGFFRRNGGVSTGIYASLNCGVGSSDDLARVAENRGRTAEFLGVAPDRLVTSWQIHSAVAINATEPWPANERPKADAIVSATPGLVIGVLTADCAPILLLGLKGTRRGGAMISDVHGNFIINEGKATAKDVLELIAVRELIADAAGGIERGQRILRNESNAHAQQFAPGRGRQGQQVGASEHNLARGDGDAGRQDAKHRLGDR